MLDYNVGQDVDIVASLRSWTTEDLSRATGISEPTLQRWLVGDTRPSRAKMEQFYNTVFLQGIRLNRIKGQLLSEEARALGRIPLFHGSKSGIEGELSIERARSNNDFGLGFYCGESIDQSVSFVSGFEDGSLYILDFDPQGLKGETFVVDQDWMLAIAWFRGWLAQYSGHPRLQKVIARVSECDYVVAPIADNRMYDLVGEFVNGYITDVQCQHCLAATDLGNQYVFTSRQALSQVYLRERRYLCSEEKRRSLRAKGEVNRVGIDKAKVARRQFRNQGLYIEELLS